MPRDHDVDGRGVSPRPYKHPSRRCVQCGCMPTHACVDINLMPCSWATPSLCTFCAEAVPAFKPGMKLYEGLVKDDGQLSVIVRSSRIGRDDEGLFVQCDLSDGLVYRPELVTALPTSAALVIAASILADCFHDDQIAQELFALFSMDVIRPRIDEQLWLFNEFQVRQWVADNKIPY